MLDCSSQHTNKQINKQHVLCTPGILAEQFADGPRFQLYNSAEKQWEDLMNWQHSTMYLFFGLAGIVSLIVHTTDVAPLALDRLMLAIAFFNEGKNNVWLAVPTVKEIQSLSLKTVVNALAPSRSHLLNFGRISFPLPPPWQDNARRPCASATSILHLWKRSRCLPGGLPQRQHPNGDAALHAHHATGKLVLSGKPKKL